MSHSNFAFNGEGRINNGSEITIDTLDTWQHLINIIEGVLFNGLEFEAGSETAITAFADAGGGQVTVTAAGHGISEDDYISISGTTNYNDLYQITNVTTDTFEITETFNGNDATGTARHGTHVVIPKGGGGDYLYVATISAKASTANTIFEFTFILDSDTNGISRRKFPTNTDIDTIPLIGVFHAKENDHVSIGIRNITNSGNITIEEAEFVIFKIN